LFYKREDKTSATGTTGKAESAGFKVKKCFRDQWSDAQIAARVAEGKQNGFVFSKIRSVMLMK
jgi:methylglyoxal synthase